MGRIRFDNVCDDGVQFAGPLHRVGSLRVSFPCRAPCSLIPTRRAKGQSLPANGYAAKPRSRFSPSLRGTKFKIGMLWRVCLPHQGSHAPLSSRILW